MAVSCDNAGVLTVSLLRLVLQPLLFFWGVVCAVAVPHWEVGGNATEGTTGTPDDVAGRRLPPNRIGLAWC